VPGQVENPNSQIPNPKPQHSYHEAVVSGPAGFWSLEFEVWNWNFFSPFTPGWKLAV